MSQPQYNGSRLIRALTGSPGLGTYQGPATDAADEDLATCLEACLNAGVDLVDTAVNYRSQRAERVIGRVLRRRAGAEAMAVTVCTKAGFIPTPHGKTSDEAAYYHRVAVDSGLASAQELSPDGHCIAPAYLQWSLERSLENLGLDRVDVLYIHNPEAQRQVADEEEVYRRLRRAFEQLEGLVDQGRIGVFGLATWQAFRCGPESPEHLSLARVVATAREVAGARHHLACIQLPLSLVSAEAATRRTQVLPGSREESTPMTALAAARALGLEVVVSAPLGGGKLRDWAVEALDFARSVPGVARVLLGARTPKQADLLIARQNVPRLSASAMRDLLARIDRDTEGSTTHGDRE